MGLEYDFDIVTIAPDELESETVNSEQPEGARVRALFRDVKTADALRGASPKIRNMFEDAGFGLETRNCGVPMGYYSPQHAADRDRILRNLFANIKSQGLKGEYSGEFDFSDFLRHIRTAQPEIGIVRKEPIQQSKPQPAAPVKPDRRTVPGRIGFALGLAVILFVLLKYLAAAGAAP
ncbi:hypothetical protein [Roseibium sp. RKSG952]|uniref:hypothetical protein n=1 Tax=Roseibium sp. RKSG952 TaxID=2529384 RepID=UPI0012BBC538|nr:hypothetical protein [Roseibium sp. RKSG952]MTI01309.1 hypothetical protein [Roseibium sp. RKSG952]